MKGTVAAAVALALAGLVSPAVAADPAGTWKWTATYNNRTCECLLTLYLDSEGPTLVGDYADGQDGRQTAIDNARFSEVDGKVSFSVTREFNRQKFIIKYSGTFSGDTITGKSQFARAGGQVQTSDWVAKRQK